MAKSAHLIKVLCAIHNFIIEMDNKSDDIPPVHDDNYEEYSDESATSSSEDENEETSGRKPRVMATREKLLMQFFDDE